MLPALAELPAEGLREFLAGLGVATHAPDGRRVFVGGATSLTRGLR